MTRLQVSLTDEQHHRLAKLARQQKISKAKLVREGIELVLRQERSETPDPLLDLIGQAGRIGRRDVARRHDVYLTTGEQARNR